MTKGEFEILHKVKLIRRSESWAMRLLGRISGRANEFWMTYRYPFQWARIAYPDIITDPMLYRDILEHEIVHVKQLDGVFGLLKTYAYYWIVPLPAIFSGRWYVERKAYLLDINRGRYTIEQAVDILWREYGWAWPKKLMREWFESHVNAKK